MVNLCAVFLVGDASLETGVGGRLRGFLVGDASLETGTNVDTRALR